MKRMNGVLAARHLDAAAAFFIPRLALALPLDEC